MIGTVSLRLALILLFLACQSAPRRALDAPKALAAEPSDWHRDEMLTGDQASHRCSADLPGCRWPFADYEMPPGPCDHKGVVCQDTRPRNSGRWMCGCHECLTDADCSGGAHCLGQPPCGPQRAPNACVADPLPKQAPCAPPVP
jgi:hypothetical protein